MTETFEGVLLVGAYGDCLTVTRSRSVYTAAREGVVCVSVIQPCKMNPCDRDGKHRDKGEAWLGSSEARSGDPSAAEQISTRPMGSTGTPGGSRVNMGLTNNTQGHTIT